jgi:hypothetical protein
MKFKAPHSLNRNINIENSFSYVIAVKGILRSFNYFLNTY